MANCAKCMRDFASLPASFWIGFCPETVAPVSNGNKVQLTQQRQWRQMNFIRKHSLYYHWFRWRCNWSQYFLQLKNCLTQKEVWSRSNESQFEAKAGSALSWHLVCIALKSGSNAICTFPTIRSIRYSCSPALPLCYKSLSLWRCTMSAVQHRTNKTGRFMPESCVSRERRSRILNSLHLMAVWKISPAQSDERCFCEEGSRWCQDLASRESLVLIHLINACEQCVLQDNRCHREFYTGSNTEMCSANQES